MMLPLTSATSHILCCVCRYPAFPNDAAQPQQQQQDHHQADARAGYDLEGNVGRVMHQQPHHRGGGSGGNSGTMYAADRLHAAREAYIYQQARSLAVQQDPAHLAAGQESETHSDKDGAAAFETEGEDVIFAAYQELYHAALLYAGGHRAHDPSKAGLSLAELFATASDGDAAYCAQVLADADQAAVARAMLHAPMETLTLLLERASALATRRQRAPQAGNAVAVLALAQEIRRALDGVITTIPAVSAAKAPARDFWLTNLEMKLAHLSPPTLSPSSPPAAVLYSLLRESPAAEATWLLSALTRTLESMPYLPLVTDMVVREVLALKLGLSNSPVDATDWLEAM